MTTMTSVAVTGPRELSTFTTPLPTLEPYEVLVRVAYTGICGSDVPRYFDGAVHSFPQVLGHEFSGVVASTGTATSVAIGTRAAVAPLVPCHTCERCQAGLPAQCPNAIPASAPRGRVLSLDACRSDCRSHRSSFRDRHF